ncbi:MAG: hypothetical protein COV67_13125 [Nitrospinae bacterium CG11_big_fil_rev_8_21_14_0_20_56_8]|nr:MAG: hypothetical protein COV67_13125 [Nitrospinae bacterium CG11_big_fil_rev_8_21_14_0_20_56_8]
MSQELPNVKQFPQSVSINQEIIEEALALGAIKSKIIQTKTIALGSWVKLQCQYGCTHFGKRYTCPPCSPTSDELSEILLDYEKALLIHGGSELKMHEIVLHLEGRFKSKGFYKAFALTPTPCDLCSPCTIETHCQYPDKARPTLQACGINVSQTVQNNGWGNSGPWAPCSSDRNIGMVLID